MDEPRSSRVRRAPSSAATYPRPPSPRLCVWRPHSAARRRRWHQRCWLERLGWQGWSTPACCSSVSRTHFSPHMARDYAIALRRGAGRELGLLLVLAVLAFQSRLVARPQATLPTTALAEVTPRRPPPPQNILTLPTGLCFRGT
jgi:hypothetical protein